MSGGYIFPTPPHQALSEAATDYAMEDSLILMGLNSVQMLGVKTDSILDANKQLVASSENLLNAIGRLDEQGLEASAKLPVFASFWKPISNSIANMDTPELRNELRSLQESTGAGSADLVEKVSIVYCRLAFCRAVDNFLSYQLDLLKLILSRVTQSFADRAKEAGIDGLDYSTVHSLLASQFEEKSNKSSRNDIEDLLKNTLGLQLYQSESDHCTVDQAVHLRNLITHRRGRVDKKFESRLSGRGYVAGQEAFPQPPQVLADMDLLRDCVFHVDSQAVKNFGLPSKPFQDHLSDIKQLSSEVL